MDALKADGRNQRLDISDAELKTFLSKRIGAFVVMGPLEEAFEELRRRGGNPDVIVMEGHGNPVGLEQFCTKELLTGKDIGRALSKQNLHPKVVLFGSCHSFEVARAARAEYLAEGLFLGTTSKRPVREIFSGDLLSARFLSWFVLFLLRSSRELKTFGHMWDCAETVFCFVVCRGGSDLRETLLRRWALSFTILLMSSECSLVHAVREWGRSVA